MSIYKTKWFLGLQQLRYKYQFSVERYPTVLPTVLQGTTEVVYRTVTKKKAEKNDGC